MHVTRCFNRTFMELKLGSKVSISNSIYSFNRTFMELKPHFQLLQIQGQWVLIGPSWN